MMKNCLMITATLILLTVLQSAPPNQILTNFKSNFNRIKI